jgi:GntR family phosphonate transport system transcriptional regulator
MSLYPIARDNGIAVYAQIAQLLEQEIVNAYAPGASLPSEAELAQRFGVNRHTLRRAIDELIALGLVERQHGKGVYVTDCLLDYRVGTKTRFTETFNALGLSTTSQVIRKLAIPATRGVAKHLAIAVDAQVVWIETLRYADERPLCVISHFLPLRDFAPLLETYVDGSLHDHLDTCFGCALRRTESLVTAVLPQGDDAKLLAIPQTRPILRVKSVNIDERSGKPVEYAVTRFRADRIQLRISP